MRTFVTILLLVALPYVHAATVNFQASGVVTSAGAQFPSITVGDQWHASITFHDLSQNLNPLDSNSSFFYADRVDGQLEMSSVSFLIERGSGNPVLSARPFEGIDELFFGWGTDPAFFVDGVQCCQYALRLDSGLSPASLSNMTADAALNYIAEVFEFATPNSSFLEINEGDIQASVDSFNLVLVPLPATSWLFLSGIFGFVGFSLKRPAQR